MGIVDYAATTCLAISGAALAAPFLETKVPALSSVTKYIAPYSKFIGIFGIFGGALGVIAIPLIMLFVAGSGQLLANLPLLFIVALELVGCVGTIGLGIMVLRRPATTEPHSGKIDMPAIVGLGGIAYGGLLMFLITAITALN